MFARVQRTDAIQKALANVYLKLYAEVKKDSNYPATTTLLKNKYNRKVYDATRKAISSVFAEGHDYVSKQLKVETYQSDSDTRLIKDETDKAVNMFWKRLEADAGRQREIQAAESRLILTQEPNEFDTLFFLESAALTATTGALAISTLTKTQQVVSDPELATGTPIIRWETAGDEKVCLRLSDGRPGCAFLDGQTWAYDDPEIPTPGRIGPNATHFNCRCILVLE